MAEFGNLAKDYLLVATSGITFGKNTLLADFSNLAWGPCWQFDPRLSPGGQFE